MEDPNQFKPPSAVHIKPIQAPQKLLRRRSHLALPRQPVYINLSSEGFKHTLKIIVLFIMRLISLESILNISKYFSMKNTKQINKIQIGAPGERRPRN